MQMTPVTAKHIASFRLDHSYSKVSISSGISKLLLTGISVATDSEGYHEFLGLGWGNTSVVLSAVSDARRRWFFKVRQNIQVQINR